MKRLRNQSCRRRGIILVHIVAGTFVFVGVGALAVDIGLLCAVRTELQNIADAAALSGASGYFSDASLARADSTLEGIVASRAQETSLLNRSIGSGPTEVGPADIVLGTFDFQQPKAPLDTTGLNRFNAVQVTTRRSADSANGAILFYFAIVLGMSTGHAQASAIAAMDDRVSGFNLALNDGADLLPFTLHIDLYDDMCANGSDAYQFTGSPVAGSDGIPEVIVFPWKESGDGPIGSGNFGVLNFDGGGAAAVAWQIQNGLTPAQLQAGAGTSNLVYVDDVGNPVTYELNGKTGAMSSMKDDLNARLGDVVGFFVHDQVTGTGENAMFRNVGIRFGRIMNVQLTGAQADRDLTLQPVTYTNRSISVSPYGRSTQGQVGRLTLVR